MRKPYQIAVGRAVQPVRRWAEEENPAVQLVLPYGRDPDVGQARSRRADPRGRAAIDPVGNGAGWRR